MLTSTIDKRIKRLLGISVLLLIIGKGILHLTANLHFDIIFQSGLAFQKVNGIILLILAILPLINSSLLIKKYGLIIFYLASFIIFIQVYVGYANAGFLPEQIVECSIQVGIPITYIHVMRGDLNKRRLIFILQLLVSATFIGHAFYAIGYHIVPSNFLVLTTNSLQIDTGEAINFLYIIGWIDIICAVLIFIPKIRPYIIWYLIVWGFLTAIARTYAFVHESNEIAFFINQVFETIYRLPHGLIPLLIWSITMQPTNFQLKNIFKAKSNKMSREFS
ncbi:hypothetical protein [Crocinitomix catalasitica]|uniref:hypothetical protein n=1 Tax=Crocinitomix catalasitica TaxID=184607 RepID=UPI000481C82B|nr:hypothetical protein [Crocinitomix catalasitica]